MSDTSLFGDFKNIVDLYDNILVWWEKIEPLNWATTQELIAYFLLL